MVTWQHSAYNSSVEVEWKNKSRLKDWETEGTDRTTHRLQPKIVNEFFVVLLLVNWNPHKRRRGATEDSTSIIN